MEIKKKNTEKKEKENGKKGQEDNNAIQFNSGRAFDCSLIKSTQSSLQQLLKEKQL